MQRMDEIKSHYTMDSRREDAIVDVLDKELQYMIYETDGTADWSEEIDAFCYLLEMFGRFNLAQSYREGFKEKVIEDV